MNALFGRVGKCIPAASLPAIISLLQPLALEMAEHAGVHPPIPWGQVYANMGAKKRRRYQAAEINLRKQGGVATKWDSRINMFVKLEGIKFTDSKVNPDCRAIQFRRPEFTLQLAAAIKRAEHALYALRDLPSFGVGRLFAKNMNPEQRASALREKYDSIPGCKVLQLDASRWDAHVNVHLLEQVEHVFWEKTCTHSQIKELLSWQRENRCSFQVRTDCGPLRQHYTVRGGRMSGDANTAAGNCQIMACLLAAFGQNRGHKFTFLCDGDDSVYFHDGPEVTESEIVTFFEQFGVVMAVEARPVTFENIEFCQSRPVNVAGTWRMVRDPLKILSKLGVNHKIGESRMRARYLMTVALGELSLCRGVPILQEHLAKFIEQCRAQMSERQKKKGVMQAAILDSYRLRELMPRDWTSGKTVPVADSTRESFARAWGLDESVQISCERSLRSWKVDLQHEVRGEGPDVAKWTFDPTQREGW